MGNMTRNLRIGMAAGALSVFFLAGCTQYVKKDEFNAAMQQLEGRVDAKIAAEVSALRGDMESRFSALDAKVTAMEGRVNVDTVAYFQFDDATLREEDKAALAAFAETMVKHHADAIVTVEGFTDPAGGRAYNKRLGQKRAEAVRDFLVANGMRADQVRAVSYGASNNRQVDRGASRDNGSRNRRASLVVDFAG